MHIYEACPEVENESVLLYIPHINDRLAHMPQKVCGWIDALPPALVRGVVRVAHTGTGGSSYKRLRSNLCVIPNQSAFLVWESPRH